MNPSRNCKQYENDELVVSGILNPDETVAEGVMNCLYLMHSDDCIRWLIEKGASRQAGEREIHNAHHAFGDALIALYASIKSHRFTDRSKPNAARRFLYRVSQRCFYRLQKRPNREYLELTDGREASIYPTPEFIFPAESEERVKKVHSLISGLSAVCCDILQKKFMEGMTTDEIAQSTGLTDKQVIRKLYDCRQKLRELVPGNFFKNY